jgi:hypothetical protein
MRLRPRPPRRSSAGDRGWRSAERRPGSRGSASSPCGRRCHPACRPSVVATLARGACHWLARGRGSPSQQLRSDCASFAGCFDAITNQSGRPGSLDSGRRSRDRLGVSARSARSASSGPAVGRRRIGVEVPGAASSPSRSVLSCPSSRISRWPARARRSRPVARVRARRCLRPPKRGWIRRDRGRPPLGSVHPPELSSLHDVVRG